MATTASRVVSTRFALAHQTPPAAQRTANPFLTRTGATRPGSLLRAFEPSCLDAFSKDTRTFLSRRLPRQVRLPTTIRVHLWRKKA